MRKTKSNRAGPMLQTKKGRGGGGGVRGWAKTRRGRRGRQSDKGRE